MPLFEIQGYRPLVWSGRNVPYTTIELSCEDESGPPLRLVCEFHSDMSKAGTNFEGEYKGE